MTDLYEPGRHAGEWDQNDHLDAIYRLMEPPAWHARAKCKGLNARLFYPARGEVGEKGNTPADEVRTRFVVRTVCATCPVQAQCLEAGMEEDNGWWGGLQRTPAPADAPGAEGVHDSR